MEKQNVVLDKGFELGCQIIQLTNELYKTNKILSNQLLRSGTLIGANIYEAQAAITKKEFVAKLSTAAKEARETKYWLMLIAHSGLMKIDIKLESLVDEVIRLLTSIIKKIQTQNNNEN